MGEGHSQFQQVEVQKVLWGVKVHPIVLMHGAHLPQGMALLFTLCRIKEESAAQHQRTQASPVLTAC